MAYNNRLCVGVPRCFVKYIFRSLPVEPFLFFLFKLCHLIFVVVVYVDCQTSRSLLSGKIVKKVIESNSINLVDLLSRWQLAQHLDHCKILHITGRFSYRANNIYYAYDCFLQMKINAKQIQRKYV